MLRQSILDRLIQRDAPEARTWEDSLAELKHNLLRDLENLLNTREGSEPAAPPEHAELARSVYNYGIPDFASMSADSARTPGRLLRAIEREIELFEPRLTDVKLTFDDPAAEKGSTISRRRNMRFLIEATLRLDPDPERVEFDTVLEMDSGRFTIST